MTIEHSDSEHSLDPNMEQEIIDVKSLNLVD